MQLKTLELSGFKSFAKKAKLEFTSPITAIVGPNGSGKSNIAEAFRFVLGEQSIKSMRGKRGEDLIWNGSTSSPQAGYAKVRLTFDNKNRIFPVDFDEVTVERSVSRDASNEYILNGSKVRLKDVVELVAGAHIGVSGHHIISQGEADRILSVNSMERKTMVEDALGLRVYQYKKEESIRKLEKTRDNISDVERLRNELKPHLRFLKKQADKIEKAEEMRDSLKKLYREYLTFENAYLKKRKEELEKERKPLEDELEKLERQLFDAKKTLAGEGDGGSSKDIITLDKRIASVRERKDEYSRELGRIEGRESFLKEHIEREEKAGREEGSVKIKIEEIEELAGRIDEYAKEAEGADTTVLSSVVKRMHDALRGFFTKYRRSEGSSGNTAELKKELAEVANKKAEIEKRVTEAGKEEEQLSNEYRELREKIEKEESTGREAERAVFKITTAQNELRLQLSALKNESEKLSFEEESYEEAKNEAEAIVGRDVLSGTKEASPNAPREKQEERRREIEKIKIRLEDAGGGSGEEILKEYTDMRERDEFLERELGDLDDSSKSLVKLIDELDAKLATEFNEGLRKINTAFQEFFSIMFGGGDASLSIVKERKTRRSLSAELGLSEEDEEEEKETEEVNEGVDISVSLPRKRIKGLQMLSGGERALTSIALLFALSRVNPPPFLILDETDAALDEANSRRYGDMIESLAKDSQLILITHNRETMSRAGVLYGVTMSADGASQLLSVNFEEATAVAK